MAKAWLARDVPVMPSTSTAERRRSSSKMKALRTASSKVKVDEISCAPWQFLVEPRLGLQTLPEFLHFAVG